MVDLAPEILRQRLVVEGLVDTPISAEQIETYLSELSVVVDMITLLPPVTHESSTFGWAGWIHWESSGAHFYAWDRPRLFFSVDIYTCKAFSAERAVDFTQRFFRASEVSYREF
jgi:S-adenosylmethionine decarboxylase